MALSPSTRRLAFFSAALLLPSALLLAFGALLIRQDAELEDRRAEDRRALVAREWTDSLFQSLERAYAEAPPPEGRYRRDTPLLHVGALEGRRLARPTERRRSSSLLDRRFQDLLIRTPQMERSGRPLEAARRYEAYATDDSAQRATLDQRAAIAYRRAGRREAFLASARRALAAPDSVLDEYGTPIALFAARLLLTDSVKAPVAERHTRLPTGWLSPADAEEYLNLRDQAGIPESPEAIAFRSEHNLMASLTPQSVVRDPSPAAPRWVLDRAGTWLVRLVDGGRVEAEPIVAVSVDSLARFLVGDAPITGFRPVEAADQASLGPPFGGLAADVIIPEANGRSRRVLSALLVALFLGLAGLSGVLLWRDVRRETRLAALRSQFVSSVSHELRTPLTSIRLYAESMRAFGADDRAQRDEDLGVIANESERLTRMLDNVLNTSRIEKGTMRYRIELGDLSEPVERAVRSMSYVFRQAGVALDSHTESVWTMMDADAMEQAVINLLSNALKYGDATPVHVRCYQSDRQAVITVSDQGRGLDPDAHERVFERFHREESAIAQNVPGAGLGLALVQHIVEAHRGSIRVDSSPGKGATFTISLPIDEA